MTDDRSAGWEAVADRFLAVRSDVGASLVRAWARSRLPAGASILDIGCGSGVPIARTLADDGFLIWGVDASPSLIAGYRRNLPDMVAACEPVQDSDLFGRTFAGAIAIGLVFLLGPDEQRMLLDKVARALEPAGRFLFTAPVQACKWRDALTGRPSLSLGMEAYAAHLAGAGMDLVHHGFDEGGNSYYEVARRL